MKHLSSILLAAAFVAGSVTACFKDPTSDLMNGPSQITLTRSAITLRTGDSIDVSAELKDDAGNTYAATDAQWVSADANVAAVRVDTIIIPADAFSRAIIRGVAAGGGTTTVTVTIRGVSKQFRVLVLPAALGATAAPAVSGTGRTDTILINLPGGVIQRDIFTVGDTVTFTVAAGSKVYFSPTASQVSFGANRAYIVSRTDSTRIKAIARAPFRGRPWVTALHYNGPTEVGTVAIDSLRGDSIVVSRPRFYGTVTIVGDTMTLAASPGSTFDTASASASTVRFGNVPSWVIGRTPTQMRVMSTRALDSLVTVTGVLVGAARVDSLKTNARYVLTLPLFTGAVSVLGDTMFVSAPTGTAFTTTGTTSVVRFGGTAATTLSRTASQISVISPINYTGVVTATRLVVGSGLIDSLKTTASYTIAKAAFPGTLTTNGTLLDTVRVFGTASAKFSLVSTALSDVTIGGAAAYVLKRTADSMLVVSRVRSTGAATISNVVVGAATIPSLPTAGNVVISDVTTGELNEPGNDSRAGATLIATPARSATGTDTVKVFGAVNADPDYDDFYTLVTTDSARIRATLYFPGTGVNPDIDAYIMSSTGSYIDGFGGGTAANPETATTTAIRAPGTYYVLVEYYDSGTFAGTNAAYMLYVRRLIP